MVYTVIMIDQLLRTYPLISDQVDTRELQVILQELEKALSSQIDGDIVEFGCYEGTTSLFMQRVITSTNTSKTLHVYDSFTGLPKKSTEDMSPIGEQFKQGELRANKKNLIKHFQHAGLPMPTIHKCWFNELNNDDLPKQIAFAFLDGDFYNSILDSLRVIEDRLSPGAVIVIDDYQSEQLPGVAKAVHNWLEYHHPITIHVEASLAILHT